LFPALHGVSKARSVQQMSGLECLRVLCDLAGVAKKKALLKEASGWGGRGNGTASIDRAKHAMLLLQASRCIAGGCVLACIGSAFTPAHLLRACGSPAMAPPR